MLNIQQRSLSDPALCNSDLDKLGLALGIISIVSLFVLTVVYTTRFLPGLRERRGVRWINNYSNSRTDYATVAFVFVQLIFFLLFLTLTDETRVNSTSGCKVVAAVLYDLFLTYDWPV